MRGVRRSRQIWVAKHVSGFCGVGKMMHRWGLWTKPNCPRCPAEVESTTHVWECPAPDAQVVWEQSIDRLREWMASTDTDPNLASALTQALLYWKQGRPVPPLPVQAPASLRTAYARQQEMGWTACLEGRLDLHWRETQAAYFKAIASRKNTLRWTAALITKLWDVAWDQWEHRNGIVHRAAESRHREELRLQVQEAIRAGRPSVRRSEWSLFDRAQSMLMAPPSTQRAWVKIVHIAQKRKQAALAMVRTQQVLMTNWLSRALAPGSRSRTFPPAPSD